MDKRTETIEIQRQPKMSQLFKWGIQGHQRILELVSNLTHS